MDLNIYDVSAVVHNAVNGMEPELYYGYPINGIAALWRRVALDFANRNAVVLCFDSPTTKHELVPTYKQGRKFNPVVASQIDSIFSDFSSINCRCLKEDGYEADDLIHAVAMANRNSYYNVNIWGNDYDLCHSVYDNIVFRTVGSNPHMVNFSIFEGAVERGKRIRFNTLSAEKSLCGCNSDKVPALHLANGLSGYALYQKFLEFYDERYSVHTYEISTSMKLFCDFICNSGLFTDEEIELAYLNALVVYPKELEHPLNLTPTSFQDLDKDWVISVLSKYGLRKVAQVLRLKLCQPTETQRSELIEKSNRLKNGVYSVDKNMELRPSIQESVLEELEMFGDDDY